MSNDDTTEQQDAMLERREVLPAWIRHRLNGAVRQYRHNNDNSPSLSNPEKGFVFAYDCGAVETLIHRILHALSRISDGGGETCPVCEKGTLTRIECCICDNCDADPVLPDQIRRNDARLFSRTSDEGTGEGDDVCMCGLTYSEHTPDDSHSFTPMREHYDAAQRQDAMLERRDAVDEMLDELKQFADVGSERTADPVGARSRIGELARTLRQSFSRTSDEAMRHALFILRHGELPPEVTREDTIRRLERAIEGCSDEGTGCVVPEAVSRYLDSIIDLERVTRQGGAEPEDLSDLEWAVQTAVQHAGDAKDELDRAIAQQGGQRVPEAIKRLPEALRAEASGSFRSDAERIRDAVKREIANRLDRAIAEQGEQGEQEWSGVPEDRAAATWLMARIIERHTEKPPGPPDPPFDRQPEWVRKAYYRQAERAIAAHGSGI